jgi:hypothetical protein
VDADVNAKILVTGGIIGAEEKRGKLREVKSW